MHAICTLPLCPVRAEASDKAEQVDQLLFGDRMTVIERLEKWSRIQCADYDYTGWIDNKQYTTVDDEQFAVAGKWNNFADEPVTKVSLGDDSILVPMGSRLPEQSDNQANKQSINPIDLAIKLLHSPYLWGGKSCMGIDCSGLTQVVFRVSGQQLPRDASQQALCGLPVDSIEKAVPNDLCFFSKFPQNNADSETPDHSGIQAFKHSNNLPITHVGIYMGAGHIIHASGQVRIDRIDNTGIFNAEQNCYTHKLLCIRHIQRL